MVVAVVADDASVLDVQALGVVAEVLEDPVS